MEDHYSEVFKQKATENFEAFTSLYSKDMFNAASNRIYYCLIHAALTKAFKTGASQDCYTVKNNDGKRIISKGQIRQNLKNIGVSNHKEFKLFLAHAESIRVKADYFYISVIKEDFDQNILNKLKNILLSEGVLT